MPTIAVSPLYIISIDLAAIGLTQPVPVVGTMTSTSRSNAPVRSSSLSSTAIRRLVGVGGLQPDVDADRLLGGPAVDPGQLVGVRPGGHEVAALESERVPGRERLWAA